jgi:hypothetical protein
LAPHIIRLGTTRGATYALRRPIRNLGDTFPLRRIDTTGRAHDWAELTALHGGWRLTWANSAQTPAWAGEICGLGGFCEGFPFFLTELRPQGFLGRAVGRTLPPSLGLSPDPREWPTDDDTLVYLTAEGDDLPGDLLVGDAMLRRAQDRLLNPPAALPESARATRYPELAATAASAGIAGSFVEGEQPKFLVTLSPGNAELQLGPSPQVSAPLPAPPSPLPSPHVSGLIPQPSPPRPPLIPVLVKFTDRLSTPTGRRWADLLIAEAVAQSILHARGEALAAPRLVHAGDRLFLETPRYDRAGAHGRRGVISLRALHDAFPGPDAHLWTAAAAHLRARDLIDAAALRSIRLRHAFGRLIGNSDMHFGNLSLVVSNPADAARGRFILAPVYDMLPMRWRPDVQSGALDWLPFTPDARDLASAARPVALQFWQRAHDLPAAPPGFRQLAAAMAQRLAEAG